MSGRTLHLMLWSGGAAAGFLAGVLTLRYRRALSPATVAALVIAALGLMVGANLQYRLEIFALPDALNIPPEALLSSPMRMPLGLVTGALLAGLWCVIVRAPWRETGDGLAVAASVMIPIGRIGCLLNGCCMGTVCGWIGNPLCRRYGPGTEAFFQQLRDGLIPADSAWSLPAHPLPLYFGAASVVTLVVLLALFRRGAAPGVPLLAFCILRPASKLALETLRATPRPPALMVGIPVAVLSTSLIVLVVLLVNSKSLQGFNGFRRCLRYLLPLTIFRFGRRRSVSRPD